MKAGYTALGDDDESNEEFSGWRVAYIAWRTGVWGKGNNCLSPLFCEEFRMGKGLMYLGVLSVEHTRAQKHALPSEPSPQNLLLLFFTLSYTVFFFFP